MAYEVIDSELSPEEQFNILDQYKIKRVETKIVKDLSLEILQQYLILRKKNQNILSME